MSYVNVPMRGLRGLGATMSAADMKSLQTSINIILQANGYAPIAVDGIIGPKTCGGLQATAQFDGGVLLSMATGQLGGNLAAACPTSTPPVKAAGTTSTAPVVIDLDAQPAAAPAPAAPTASSLLTSKNVMIAGGVVAAIIVVVYASKKKGKKPAAAAA